ncbi:MAG: hypothetical protein LBS59_01550 [Puniceicoccales bacterium]|jgi:tetratricopeptide (TPR) repeat protein|nr:hypothetical protein [Puniceicoccales bacterium]
METKTTKAHILITVFSVLSALAIPLAAQKAPTPFGTPVAGKSAPAPTPAAQPAPAPAPATGGTAGDYSSGTAERGMDKIFDVNKDSVDLENGTMNWKGKTFNLGNSRVIRARIERYLSSPKPEDDIVAHAKILQQIEDLLSPKVLTAKNYSENYQKAWELLFKAAKYEIDAESCLTIATLVDKTVRTKQQVRGLRLSKNEQEVLRRRQSRDVIIQARTLEEKKDRAALRATGKKGQPAADVSEGSEELAHRRETLGRTDAEIRKTDTAITAIETKAKLEFQSQIFMFLLQRRFKHVTIATAFYRYTFGSSEQQLRVGDRQIKEMFPVSNFVPTMDSLDMLAREALKDVETSMRTVEQLCDTGGRYKALERLQEAFFLGEYTPKVMFFDPEKKAPLMKLWRHVQDLQRIGDERDLAGVEEVLQKISAVADDFPVAVVRSRANNARRMSNLSVLAAKQAALGGDLARAEQNVERAAKFWPSNPMLEEFANMAVARAEGVAQKIPEFDRLEKDGKTREIYTRKEEFAMVLFQDKERSEKLRIIIERALRINGMLEQAKLLKKQGNPFMAWDVLHEAAKLGPEDTEVLKAHSDFAATAAEYARCLDNAERQEAMGNFSASLAWYLSAGDMNPTSELCQRGIKRTGEALLNNARTKLAQ